MGSRDRFAVPAAALALAVLLPAARADVLLLHDGKRIEGDVKEAADSYEVTTKYGKLVVAKNDVKKIYKDPAEMTAEAATCRKIARGMYDEALKIEDPKERNRKLTAGTELLEKALKIYNEAREVFTGSSYDYLDKAAVEVVQEMRLYRDKMVTEQVVKPPEPPKPEPPAPEPVPEPPVVAKAPDLVPPKPPAPAPAPKPEPAKIDVASLDPVKPPTAQPVKAGGSGGADAPPAAGRTPKELVADLASSEAAVRQAAVEQLAKTPAPDAVAPMAELVKKEETAAMLKALTAALSACDGAAVAKQAALKDVAQKGSDAQKQAVIAIFKKTGGEAGIRFLVDTFVAFGEVPLRKEVASALKKHKALAVKPLIDLCRKSAAKPDIQVDCIKYLGIIGESKTAPQLLVPILEVDETRNITVHALRKIDKPVIPSLIQAGLPGGTHARQWSAWLLRYFTGQSIASQNAAEWTVWWNTNKRAVAAEEAKWDKADEASDWLVDEFDWTEFDVDITGNIRFMAMMPGRFSANLYQSSRGRPRGQGPAAARTSEPAPRCGRRRVPAGREPCLFVARGLGRIPSRAFPPFHPGPHRLDWVDQHGNGIVPQPAGS
jgi:hypothetical protein